MDIEVCLERLNTSVNSEDPITQAAETAQLHVQEAVSFLSSMSPEHNDFPPFKLKAAIESIARAWDSIKKSQQVNVLRRAQAFGG